MNDFSNKFHGCLMGLAVGDALGGPLEFSDRDGICSFTEMEGNFHYNLPAGCWTDKTAEMLCVSESLIENQTFDHDDFLTKYHQFIMNGHLAPFGKPLELTQYIKITALKIGLHLKYRKPLPPIINPDDYHQIDCEPLYRIAPIVLAYYNQPLICMEHIENMSKTTHISQMCADACKFYASLMIGALMGVSKNTLLSSHFNIMDVTTYGSLKYNKITHDFLKNCTDTLLICDDNKNSQKITCKSTKKSEFIHSLFPSISDLLKGLYKNKKRGQIRSDNQIVHCLEAALWAFYSTDNFEDGCILAINLGLSSNAIGAIYGQLAGIYYGFTQIPQRWLTKLHRFKYLYEISQNLNKFTKS
jgi:ADP-ribosyl-[dinitrogen reductase] hydrolase